MDKPTPFILGKNPELRVALVCGPHFPSQNKEWIHFCKLFMDDYIIGKPASVWSIAVLKYEKHARGHLTRGTHHIDVMRDKADTDMVAHRLGFAIGLSSELAPIILGGRPLIDIWLNRATLYIKTVKNEIESRETRIHAEVNKEAPLTAEAARAGE